MVKGVAILPTNVIHANVLVKLVASYAALYLKCWRRHGMKNMQLATWKIVIYCHFVTLGAISSNYNRIPTIISSYTIASSIYSDIYDLLAITNCMLPQ